jgi:oligopeptide transport system substrate-binding protein
MKRLNLRSSFAMALLLALVLPILAACGGGTPAASPTAAPAPAAEPTAAAPAAEATAEPAAGGGTANAVPGVLRLNHGPEADNYDPQQASFVGEIQFIMLAYQGLTTFDKDMKPIPGQAESIDVSADGKTYTFKLRADSKYSDGSPLTAANYEFAWKRLADPELAGEYQFLGCDIIAGYSEYAATTCQGKTITETQALDLPALKDAMGVKAIDDSTLEIKLANPAPYFLSIAALWAGVPTREEDANNVTDLAGAVPESYIGNGPFILTQHDRDQKAVFEINPNYQGPNKPDPAKLKSIEFSFINESAVAFEAYKNGELDINAVAAEDLAAVEADPVLSKEVVDVAPNCTFYLAFNNARAPFDKKEVRQAFAQAFDREAYVRDVLQGLGITTQTFIPPGFPGYEASDMWPFNADAAKKALADAGYPNGQGLPEIKLTFSSSARNKVRNEWIANQLKQNLGLDVILDPVDPTAYTALTKDPSTYPQLSQLGWCADFPDPQNWLTAVFKTNGSSAGRITWSNKEFDDLVTQADVEPDATKRAQLYSQAQKILIEDTPVAFLYNLNSGGAKIMIKPYVKGVEQTPLDYIPGFFNMPNLEVAP